MRGVKERRSPSEQPQRRCTFRLNVSANNPSMRAMEGAKERWDAERWI